MGEWSRRVMVVDDHPDIVAVLSVVFTMHGYDHVRILAIDPATDTVTETTDDARCQSISPSGVTSDGTAYFSPWDYHAAVRGVFGVGYGSASCGLRVVPAGTKFDAGYTVDLSSLVGGKPAGGLHLTSDTEALIHVWNSDLVPATPDTWGDDRFKPGYTWYRWHLGDGTATPPPSQQPSSEGGEWRTLDGMTVTYNPNSEYTETTLVELGADDALTTHVTIPGWIVNMVRVR